MRERERGPEGSWRLRKSEIEIHEQYISKIERKRERERDYIKMI